MSEPLCDLVLLVWNHLEETQPCVETLLKYTDVPARLLIVDNGSEEPTRAYLDTVRPAGQIIEVNVLRNPTNEGYPAGMNRGLTASMAAYVCLLNNDLLFAPSWLSEMIAVAESDPAIGLVNPSSSTFGQRPAPGQSIESYAEEFASARGQWIEMGSSIGFCMLIKREVKDKVGLMEPAFGIAYFEDTDYSRRAQAAGYRCVRANGAYVYHAEHRTLPDAWPTEQKRRQAFANNARIFYARWGKPERQAYVLLRNGASDWIQAAILQCARADGTVWVYYPQRHEPPSLAPHMGINYKPLSDGWVELQVLWQILKKKKKFDRIVLNHQGIAWILKRLRWLHRAQIDVR